MTDPRIEAAARALNTAGWTCYDGSDEPGQYDECADCKRYCDTMATAALAAAHNAATITTVEGLDALPVGTVILTREGWSAQKTDMVDQLWWRTWNELEVNGRAMGELPARVIHWGNNA